MKEPISPKDIDTVKLEAIPDVVIEVFNQLIVENWKYRGSVFKQNEVIERILARDMNITRDILFDRGWLDIESLYRAKGWIVTYDRPGYDESYEAYFKFEKKGKK